jgi:hypothetical protein
MRLVSLLGALCLVLAATKGARAHTIPGGITLSERVALSDVVAVATIRRTSLPEATSGDGRRRPLVEATIAERIRGTLPPGDLRFEPHSHSGDTFAAGERVVLFLRRQEPGNTSAPEYSTVDDVTDRISLGSHGAERPSAGEVLAAVRAYSGALSAKDDASRAARRKETTLALLRSSDPKLHASALRDLAQGSVGLDATDAPALLAAADDPGSPMSLRVSLLEELSRRGLVDPAARYAAWLERASLAEMGALTRAAGRRRHPTLTAALIARSKDADEETAALAARALGEPFHEDAVPALTTLAAAPDRRKLASAAIESLGRMGTPAARDALSALLDKTDDPERRRAIQTQLNRLAQRAPAPSPSPAAPATSPVRDAETTAERPSWTPVLALALALAVAGGLWLSGRPRG